MIRKNARGRNTIPDDDAETLKRDGVAAIFQPGASLEAIVSFIRSAVAA